MATPSNMATARTEPPHLQMINGHPVGMPDPIEPWPWKSQAEREKQAATPYWQARFRKFPQLYSQWILKKPA